MHIGSCSVFEGPAPGDDEVVSLIASKLSSIPRYRQKVRFVPGGIGRPVWVYDAHFNLDAMSATRRCRRPDRYRICPPGASSVRQPEPTSRGILTLVTAMGSWVGPPVPVF